MKDLYSQTVNTEDRNYRASGTRHPKPFTQGNPITSSVAVFTEPYEDPQNIEKMNKVNTAVSDFKLYYRDRVIKTI